MKTKILLLLLAVPFLLNGQSKLSKAFNITLSNPYAVVDAKDKQYYSVNNGNEILSIKSRGDIVTTQLFSVEGMNEISRKEYEDFPKYAKFVDIIHIDDEHMYYIYEAYNKKSTTFSVFARVISTADGTFGPNKELFTSASDVIGSPSNSIVFYGVGPFAIGLPKFKVSLSFDKSKILIDYRTRPENKNDSKNFDRIGMYVFDNELNSIWGEEVKMPYTEAIINNLAYGISNNGSTYTLIQKEKVNDFELLVYKNGELTKHTLDINKDLKFQRMEVKETADGNVICAGFYANGTDIKVDWTGNVSTSFNTDGIYYFTMDKDGNLLTAKQIEFPIAFIKLYLSPKQKEKIQKREKDGKAGISDLKLINFTVNKDGSFVFIGEQQYARNEMYFTSQKMVYHYEAIIATKVNNEGDVIWMKKLPKDQAGVSGQGGMSVKYVKAKDSHYFLFLDNAKNINLSPTKVPAEHKDGAGGFLTTYIINDETGNVEKHGLADITNVKGQELYQFNVTRIFEAKQGVFFLEVYLKGKKDGMLKMGVKE